jgi:hypothetical protein
MNIVAAVTAIRMKRNAIKSEGDKVVVFTKGRQGNVNLIWQEVCHMATMSLPTADPQIAIHIFLRHRSRARTSPVKVFWDFGESRTSCRRIARASVMSGGPAILLPADDL